ncbi:YbaB/EbfC family nucleoid-associated protein [Actinomadura violacea]|uniref:YbaB/EbfC family nucleoid-associated protein n=1 Tax=Actinomadura violacea TaxID=2819934 RepID=A0ABS3RRM0_9ACTN|nr:YbaB/EbfC family nucleoid-associated protein [Actinomadura violacea]MBO2459405.1 YbaB/EbfC family nucleoid-associated protein [Actinomadura violacea]
MPLPLELQELSAQLSRARITAIKADGAVTVEIDGRGELLDLGIDSHRLGASRLHLIEAAIVDAINEAEDRSAALEEQLYNRMFGDE